jgi:ribosome biogenesis GTPase A
MINKSDFLSPQLVEHWNRYFNERNIKHFFFSALIEQDKLDLEDEAEVDSEPDEVKEVAEQLEQIKVEDALAENAHTLVFSREFIEADEVERIANQ